MCFFYIVHTHLVLLHVKENRHIGAGGGGSSGKDIARGMETGGREGRRVERKERGEHDSVYVECRVGRRRERATSIDFLRRSRMSG